MTHIPHSSSFTRSLWHTKSNGQKIIEQHKSLSLSKSTACVIPRIMKIIGFGPGQCCKNTDDWFEWNK